MTANTAKHSKVIILGSGPAGCTAAIYAARAMLEQEQAQERLDVPVEGADRPFAFAVAYLGGRMAVPQIPDVAVCVVQIVIAELGTFFTGGLRAYDIANPYQPKEAGTFVPKAPALAPRGTIQLNDVFVDEREIVYTVDRFSGGLYILEMDF